MEQQLVIFELSGEQYGVDIAVVESIVKMPPIVKIPQTLDYVAGVTNHRGNLLPVIDMKKRLSLDLNQDAKDLRVIIVTLDGIEMGMIVDSVSEVLIIDNSVIEPAPEMITIAKVEFVTGIAKIGQQLVMLLDLSRVFSVEDCQISALLPG